MIASELFKCNSASAIVLGLKFDFSFQISPAT